MASLDAIGANPRAVPKLRARKDGAAVPLTEGDKRLLNQYGVMLVNPEKHPNVKKELGQTFIDWLISPEGQAAIAGYKVDGQQVFFPNADKPGG